MDLWEPASWQVLARGRIRLGNGTRGGGGADCGWWERQTLKTPFRVALGTAFAATLPPCARWGPGDSLLAAELLRDCLNLCSQPSQPLCFIAALSRSAGVKTRDYTVSVVPF